MTKILLTDLTIQRLKPPEKGQTAYWDTNLRGFGVRLSQGGTKTFVVQKGGKLVTLGRYPAMTLKTAREEAKKAEAVQSTSKGVKRLQESLQLFLASSERQTKPATVYQYQMYLKRLTLEKPLSAITRADVTEHLKLYDGKPTSQNYAYGTLRTFFNWCIEQEYITHSPIARMRAPNRLKSRERTLTDDEIRKIWQATEGWRPYGSFVRVLLLSGQRKMEIYKVTEFTETLTFPDTKNGKAHTIPVTPLVKEHLQGFRINHWSTQKDKLDQLSGVTGWRLHDLRRTLATNMARLGIRSETIERILNHTERGVKGTYQRWAYVPEMREALETHERFIRTLVEPGLNPGRRDGSTTESRDEDTQQTGATPEDDHINPAHHPVGEGWAVPQTSPVDYEQGRVVGE